MNGSAIQANQYQDGLGNGQTGVASRLIRTLFNGLQGLIACMRSHKSESPPVPEKHPSESTRAVDAVGNLCDTRVLDVFHRRCVQAMNPERRTVVVDLARVTSVDTKLIATLITLLKQARAAGKSLDLTVSDRVYDWIRLCQVERLLCPKRARRHAATQIRKPRHARVSRCRHPKRLSRPASRRPATMGNHVAI